MRRFHLLTVPATAALLAAVLAPAAVASAATSTDGCATSVTLPSRIAIVSSMMSLSATLRSNCTIGGGSYDVVRSDGAWTYGVIWSRTGSSNWYLTSTDGPGRYQATGGSVYDANYNDLQAPDSNVATAKYNSHLTWRTATRSGSYITLQESTRRYSYDANWGGGGYVNWNGARVRFQRYSSGAWHTVKTATSSSGVATVRIYAPRSAPWRAVVSDSGTVWGGHSGAHTR